MMYGKGSISRDMLVKEHENGLSSTTVWQPT